MDESVRPTNNAANQPVLMLDGVSQAIGMAIAPGTDGNVTFTVTHGAYVATAANQNFSQSIKAGGTFLISNGWGPALKSTFQGDVNAGFRLILPARCDIAEASWSGAGYFKFVVNSTSMSFGALIGGGLAGGFSTTPQPVAELVDDLLDLSISTDALLQSSGDAFGDPIDMVQGHYLYAREDLTAGLGAFPLSLSFQKLYSSGARTQDGPLGKGWTHNLAASARLGSDGFQGLGEDSALDAVGSIVETMVSLDLLSDAAKPLDKLVIATLGQRWYGDQLIDNTVIVRQGLNGEVFVKLPDGGYNAPPGNPAKLSQNPDASYSYETLHKAKLNFDGSGRIAAFLDPSGLQVKFTYSGNDLAQVTNSLGRSLTFTMLGGRVTQVNDGSRSIKYGYDASGNLVTFTDAANKSTTFKYDLPGRLTQIFYPSKPTVAFATNTYDSLGRIQTQTDANGHLYSYYFAGARSEEVGPGNVSRVSYLNALGKVTQAIDPLGRVTTQSYDGQGRLTQTVLPEGNALTYAYDDAPCAAQKRCTHNLKTSIQVAKPGSGLATLTTGYSYEASFNQVETVTDPRGKVASSTYTSQGQLKTLTRPTDAAGVAPVATYAYSPFSAAGYPSFYLPTSVTEKTSATNTVVTATTYNGSNKFVPATTVVDSGSGKLNLTAAYTYTANGLQATVQDAKNNLTSSEYDGHDRLLKTRYPSPSTVNASSTTDYEQYGYDANGNLTSQRKRNGQSVTLGYDNLNRLIGRTYPNTADNVSFAYDLLGRRTAANYANASYNLSYVWDNAGRLTSTAAGGKTLAFQYDPAGNRTRLTWPDGFFVTTTYDALNRPTEIQENGSVTLARYNSYDDLSRRIALTLGNATATSYGYDLQGGLGSLGHDLAGSGADIAWTYSRNQVGEIVAVSASNDAYQWAGAPPGTTSYSANGLNQYTQAGTASLLYDASANLQGDGTWSYGYDVDNRLRSATHTNGLAATLAYDAAGRLRETQIGALTTEFLYDGTDLVAEYDSAGNLLRRYVHGPGTDEPLVWYEGSGTANKSWLYADHLGSIVATANSAGTATAAYRYGPYGEPDTATGERFRYTGQQLLGQLGLYHYKARFYSPRLGRFLQTDPIGYRDDLNLYAYVGNDPVNANDPLGLETQYSVSVGGTAAMVLLGVGASLNVGISVPDNIGDWRDYQVFVGLQANLMGGGGGYVGYGLSVGRSVSEGPLTPALSTDSGWYAEIDAGIGPVAVGASLQGPGSSFSSVPSAGSITSAPKVGMGAGFWISPVGKYGSVTLATPTFGSIVDGVGMESKPKCR